MQTSAVVLPYDVAVLVWVGPLLSLCYPCNCCLNYFLVMHKAIVDIYFTKNIAGVQIIFFARFKKSWWDHQPRQPKKGVSNTKFTPKLESPTLPPPPTLTKIGDHPPHGGKFPSSDWTFKEKCPPQHIIYPLGSVLAREIFDLCCLSCCCGLYKPKKQQKRHNNDEDQCQKVP
jgi:hypothetical protein